MANTISEAQLRPAVLLAFAKSPSGFMTISDLIAELAGKGARVI
jgi:hypothetical protein